MSPQAVFYFNELIYQKRKLVSFRTKAINGTTMIFGQLLILHIDIFQDLEKHKHMYIDA